MENNIVVLGAGIAGLSAAYHIKKELQKEVVVYEKTNDWGGLCGGFYLDSPNGKFWFDTLPHLSFAKDKYVQDFFAASSEPLKHIPNPINFYEGHWIKHPMQNNLFGLSVDIRVNVLKDMIENKNDGGNVRNFEEWLKAQYGDYFTENFSKKYTRKYWSVEAKELNVNPAWVGPRFYHPNLSEILYGAMSEDTPVTYYAKEMRYPKEGQYRSFFKKAKDNADIKYNKEVIKIDWMHKEITFSDATKTKYNYLVSTLPLPGIIKIMENVPNQVQKAAKKLYATSAAIVSFGFKKEVAKNLWFYIYDEDKLFARDYSPSKKSPKNAPNGCSSLQAEIYFSPLRPLESMLPKNANPKEYCIKHVKEKFVEMGICEEADIVCEDFRILPYGNVMFTHGMEENRQIVLDYLQECEIISCGRFGEWDYLWSDQSFLSGMKICLNIKV